MYCPISEQKAKKDVIYINEWPTRSLMDLVTEIRMCSSKGAGITGGDPLARLDRTVRYIRHMKRILGKS
ncbi:MAG: radical SAM protein, partial [Nitrospirae bacterium]|nr:radical SAM protein [Nitrospirota bacterium]